MLLTNKVAVIYGASGAVGSTLAMTFAREGATLFLTGHSLTGMDELAEKINAAGGSAEVARVDALDERAVEMHLNRVIERAGRFDISFNAIGLRNTTLQGTPLTDLALDQFMAPIQTHLQANFITARLAGRLMAAKGSGVIMTVTSTPSRVANPLMGGVAVAMAAEEALIRDLSVEVGPKGVRVLGIRTHGMPDSDTIKEVFGLHARAYDMPREQFQQLVAERTHRKRLPSLQEMAEVAVFMASDNASAMMGTVVNMSLGAIAD
ncbi:SDR family NAD(P)-dependent oxidoreductase [Spirosoma endbachense]|uniref:SDR family oxidoreductase n=1 Tax=Spirosoma endbachense TaxID=2666025 RepID=A0A6P1VWD7_9BACT|nr:SDR family oxidoreductase [Spirosoma endbachense]QHV96688.1 SDR family oxidoreductase [Spirosoma endbachense]